MFYVGIDFGSTYTTVSVYRPETESLAAKALSEGGTPFIPSVLAISKNQISIGKEAKTMMTMPGRRNSVKSFRAFKMMLAEADEKSIRARGFDEEYTPEYVTQEFLEKVLRRILERENETVIDHLVVGVPEIWNNEITTVDGRTRLRDICRRFPFIRRDADGNVCVQIVSEPAAASAYFSYNFKQETGRNFDGRLLLIDYGGGTLDLTLTDVETRPDKAGREGMEIRVLKRTGAGENEEGRVGQAGIAYMETLMENAICEVFPEMAIEHDADFYQAVDMLEAQLQECTSMIKGIFDEYGTNIRKLTEDAMDEADYFFSRIFYKGMPIDITYQQLVRTYHDVIRGIFEEKLDEVIHFMEERGIDYMNRKDDRFKIVLVGGFGNYYLVQEQVSKKFTVNSMDNRQKHVIQSQEDCEKAISLGSALLASGVIRIRNTAPYSIGVCAEAGNGISLTYGLYLNQDIEFNKVYFQRDEYGDYVVLLSLSGGIHRFIINTHDDKRAAMIVRPKPEFRNKLGKVITNRDSTAVVGFSVDSSGVLSLHIHDYDSILDKISSRGERIELTNFKELFDVQVLERAYKDE